VSIEKAKAYYLGNYGHKKLNCCQAVAAAFSDKLLISKETMDRFASYGGGKAPDGECGAVYAAKYIIKNIGKGSVEECNDIILAHAGAAKCREIRQLRKLPCIGCVEKMAEYIEKIK
jgi:Asp/Glu/hydantoin racemase